MQAGRVGRVRWSGTRRHMMVWGGAKGWVETEGWGGAEWDGVV